MRKQQGCAHSADQKRKETTGKNFGKIRNNSYKMFNVDEATSLCSVAVGKENISGEE